MLGQSPTRLDDVYQVFSDYILGKIPLLPWCESSLQPESFTIQKELAALNRSGFLTINSQPAVNGVASDDTVFGWGGKGGYCYQKVRHGRADRPYAARFTLPGRLPLCSRYLFKLFVHFCRAGLR